MAGTGWAATVLPFSKSMRQAIISTIAAALLAGCGTTSSQKPAEAQSVHTAAKVEVPGIPIHQAAWKGDMEIVQQHLAAGTGVDAKNKWGSTALHYTARGGQVAVAGLLISSSADVNAKDAAGLTPLHFAASAGHGEVAKLLIAKGADVKAKGGEQKASPIFSAAKKNRGNIVELLLANGANVNLTIAFGDTPLDWAVRNKKEDVAAILRNHGGKTGAELETGGK